MLPLPSWLKAKWWDDAREHKDFRLRLSDAPFIPAGVRVFLKGTVKVGAVLTWLLGPDPKAP